MKEAHFRRDIQSLRAFAVLLVVIGHLLPNWISGGFIGVDIFFVISGFVITSQMIRHQQSNPKGFILDFYSRRIRRIIPSALVVIILTTFATKVLLGPVILNNLYLDGFYATVFLSNIHFSRVGLDYFSSGIQISPIQHFWSLSIEEQFYFVWPTIFILFAIFKINNRLKVFLVAFIVAVSFMLSMYHSLIENAPTFFSTSSRIWELGAGVLLAMSRRHIILPNFVYLCLLFVLSFSAFVIPQTMQWPSLSSIPIVLITIILLSRSSGAPRLAILDNAVTSYVGDLSYLIYLWHWPVLVIIKAYSDVSGAAKIILVISLTGFLSVLTHYVVEKPIRNSARLAKSPTIVVFCGSIAVVILATLMHSEYQG